MQTETIEMGKCDKCGRYYPISRGENFYFIEETCGWECYRCHKITVDINRVNQLLKAGKLNEGQIQRLSAWNRRSMKVIL